MRDEIKLDVAQPCGNAQPSSLAVEIETQIQPEKKAPAVCQTSSFTPESRDNPKSLPEEETTGIWKTSKSALEPRDEPQTQSEEETSGVLQTSKSAIKPHEEPQTQSEEEALAEESQAKEAAVAAGAVPTLSDVLEHFGLSKFLESLLKLGVESISDLSDCELITDSELQDIVGFKLLQVRRLRRAARAARPHELEPSENTSPNKFTSAIPLQHQPQEKQPQKNKRRQAPPRPRRKTKYVGVTDDLTRNPLSNSWMAQMTKNSKMYFLGRYATAQAAARAFDDACASAGLPRKNFPIATSIEAALHAGKPSSMAP